MNQSIMQKFQELSAIITTTTNGRDFLPYKGERGRFYAKLEYYNLTGSIKERIAYEIMKCM